MRGCIYSAALAAMASTVGCASPQKAEVDRLRKEISAIRSASGEIDPTCHVLLIFLADTPPSRGLSLLNDPKNLFVATHRFVLIVVGPENVSIRYRQKVASYSLRPRLYGPLLSYAMGGRDLLADHFLNTDSNWLEYIVVADLDLNPIEMESPSAATSGADLLEKYGHYLKGDYEIWLRNKPSS